MKTTFSDKQRIYMASMGKIFRVTHICETIEEANDESRKNSGRIGVIATDNAGRHYLAELYGSIAPSAILNDLKTSS